MSQADPGQLQRKIRLDRAIVSLFVLLVVVSIVFLLTIGDEILSVPSLQAMAFQMPELGILSLAMMITILIGGINLSIVATANFVSIAMAYLFTRGSAPPAGLEASLWVAAVALAGLILATGLGLINGIIIAYLRVSPILATLGTMTFFKGVSVGLTHGTVLSGFPDELIALGNGTVSGVPVPILIFMICALPMGILFARTPLGVKIYMIGSNEEATRFSAVNTRVTIMKAYAISGALCGVASVVMMARFSSANASYGESYLLVTILAAVLGGVNPDGGFGRVTGLVLALVILQITASGFNLLGLSSHLALAIWGLLLIITMVTGYFSARVWR